MKQLTKNQSAMLAETIVELMDRGMSQTRAQHAILWYQEHHHKEFLDWMKYAHPDSAFDFADAILAEYRGIDEFGKHLPGESAAKRRSLNERRTTLSRRRH